MHNQHVVHVSGQLFLYVIFILFFRGGTIQTIKKSNLIQPFPPQTGKTQLLLVSLSHISFMGGEKRVLDDITKSYSFCLLSQRRTRRGIKKETTIEIF
jgi:hypothetical protein